MYNLNFRSAALAVALSLSAGAAQAVTVTWQNGASVFGSNGKTALTIDSKAGPDVTMAVNAGGFALAADLFGNGAENFVAWCLDIATTIKNGKNYDLTDTPFSSRSLTVAQIADIGRLFGTNYASLDLSNNAASAGFQLALWEIAYEVDGAARDLASGNFTVSGAGAADAIAAGQGFLNNLGGVISQSYNLLFLESSPHDSQHLVTATPVPVPAAGLLLIGAIGGLVAVRRRKVV